MLHCNYIKFDRVKYTTINAVNSSFGSCVEIFILIIIAGKQRSHSYNLFTYSCLKYCHSCSIRLIHMIS